MIEENALVPTFSGDYVILLYHGVYADGLDLAGRNSSGKHISASEFKRQMEIVSKNWNVVSMLDISEAHKGQFELPERAIAITFDDGFGNVYNNAWPILSSYGLKATFYLTTGFIDSRRASWTDQLEIMIIGADTNSIRVQLDDEWIDYSLDGIENQISTLTHIKKKAKQLEFQNVRRLLDQVELETGVEPSSSHPLYEMVTWDQVRELRDDETFDLGAHTVNHIPVSRMPFDEMTWEVNESIKRVSREVGTDIKLFSYPEGQSKDFDEITIRFLKSIGIDFCPTAIDGVNNLSRTDPFHIHRCMVGFEGRPFILT